MLVLINKNNNDFKSKFYKWLHKKIYTFFSLNSTKNNNFPRTLCQNLTDPQGSADHSLGSAGPEYTPAGLFPGLKRPTLDYTYGLGQLQNPIVINLEQIYLQVNFKERQWCRSSIQTLVQMHVVQIIKVIGWQHNQLEMKILELIWIGEMNNV